jgi:hypothetical protein
MDVVVCGGLNVESLTCWILQRFDRKNILSQAQSQSSAEKWDISLKQIDQKIAGREYSNITEYKVRTLHNSKKTLQLGCFILTLS